jgi:serine protease
MKKKLLAIFLLFVSPGFWAKSSSAYSDLRWSRNLERARFIEDEIVVKFKPSDLGSRLDKLDRQFGLKFSSHLPRNVVRLKIPAGKTVEEALKILKESPDVLYAEPNYLVEALSTPNDPYFFHQWHLSAINAEKAWSITTGAGAVVAVLDTGIAFENYGWWYRKAPDLAGTSFVKGYDFVNNDAHSNDDNGHGTHVAGTIAQTTNNNFGVAGLAYSATLMPVKVLDRTGSGTYADVVQGIYFAADHGAQVINLSLGGNSPSQTLEDALAYAYNKGTTIVAAAGNDGKGELVYPAAYNEYVVAVGAIRFDEEMTSYSNYGAGLDLAAPGGDLSVDQNSDGYADGVLQQTFARNRPKDFGYYFYQGTSMAAAHVSGAAALVVSSGISDPQSVRDTLEDTAKDKGPAGWDGKYGFGIVDAFAAINYAAPTLSPIPTSTFTPTPTPTPTVTPTLSPTPSPTPTSTPSPSFSPTPSPTPSPTLNPTPTPSPTSTQEPKEQLALSASTTDNRKNPKTSFRRGWEEVYVLVEVNCKMEPVDNANISLQVKDPRGRIVKKKSGATKDGGEFFVLLGRFSRRGEYSVFAEAEKEDFLPATNSTSFNIY